MTAAIEITPLETDYNFNCPSCAARLGWVTPEGVLRFTSGAKPWITSETHQLEQQKIYDRGLFATYDPDRHGMKVVYELLDGTCHQCETQVYTAIVPMREREPRGLCPPKQPKFSRALRRSTGETWLVITHSSAFGPRREHMFGPFTLDARCDVPSDFSDFKWLSIATAKDPAVWWGEFIAQRWAELWAVTVKPCVRRTGGGN